jgi:Flp pilus assembly protein TadD
LACAAGALAFGHGGLASQASAQAGDAGKSVSYPVVQPLPSRESLQLNAALSKLGRNPRDLDALIDAGNSALAMGDVDAAFGFFRRADQISPKNAKVKAGLAAAMVRKGDPVEAIALFDEAERAGANDSALAGDRGLAYDLVGDNATAQRYYHLALRGGPDDEITRRLALSLAISGDQPGVEMALLPLLRRQDKAAWRTRAFALAIMGKTDEAVRITKTILPEKLAGDIAPYLRYMPRLTPAQQAAAANLGDFPRASEIGRDDPRIAQLALEAGVKRSPASADAGLVPQGEPLGRQPGSEEKASKQQKRSKKSENRAKTASRKLPASSNEPPVRTEPPEPQPARQAGPASEPALAASPEKAVPPPAPEPETKPVAPSSEPSLAKDEPPVRLAAKEPVAAPLPAKPPARPGFDLAQLPNSQVNDRLTAVTAPLPETVEAEPQKPEEGPGERLSLAEAFSDLGKPTANAAPVAGAVDIRKITPAKPEPPKPPPPSHPSRIWVQLGIGRDKSALAFDWRRLVRKAPDAFRGQQSFVSEMGQTNRMLAGPFESAAAANKFVGALREAGIDGPYVWTSPAGQVVDRLR